VNGLIQHGNDWLSFTEPVEVLTARTSDEVFQCLEKIEQSGLWAAGFVSYEAAGAFDDALKTHPSGKLPLLCFGLFEEPEFVGHPEASGCRVSQAGAPAPQKNYQLGSWTPSVTRGEYAKAIAEIKEHIAAGDTYQVNYTFRLSTDFSGEPFSFFCDLTAAQQGGYSAFIETDEFAICSASPELFFDFKDGTITSRPMKGTLPRALTAEADRAAAEALQHSAKNRAENIMIVDMIRNDIGRVAEAGSVETLRRFDVEKYPTVWQMTSTVQGKVGTPRRGVRGPLRERSLPNLFRALFPCASITGAPKAKTMEIICELEKGPRGIYTGAIGFIAPGGTAQFNVAIRTAVIQDGKAEYGIGGGIVWDSDADSEYDEAMSKAAILTKKMPAFQILEAVLYEPDAGLFLLDRHLKRLADSAEYFDFKVDLEKIRAHLEALQFQVSMKIRLLLDKDGKFEAQNVPVQCSNAYPKGSVDINKHRFPPVGRVNDPTLAVAKEPVNAQDVFLYHKTTNRAVYEQARAARPDVDDVLLFNERGEITESCRANVVVELDGRKVTPPVSSGLLAGTFRAELLENGEIEEGIITLDDLKQAKAVWLINSVRKWQEVTLNCSA